MKATRDSHVLNCPSCSAPHTISAGWVPSGTEQCTECGNRLTIPSDWLSDFGTRQEGQPGSGLAYLLGSQIGYLKNRINEIPSTYFALSVMALFFVVLPATYYVVVGFVGAISDRYETRPNDERMLYIDGRGIPIQDDHYVEDYLRSDGTYVEGHWRTNPDETVLNNYGGPYGNRFREANNRPTNTSQPRRWSSFLDAPLGTRTRYVSVKWIPREYVKVDDVYSDDWPGYWVGGYFQDAYWEEE